MKKVFICLTISSVFHPAFAGNLIANDGFETGSLQPWQQVFDGNPFGSNWAVTNTQSYSGTYSATDVGNKELAQYFAPTSGSLINNISFAMKQDDGGAPGVSEFDVIYSDSTTSFDIITPNDTAWHVYNETSIIDPTKTVIGIGIFGFDGGPLPTTFVDSFNVNAVPEPGSLLPLGLLALAFAKKKLTS